jgi:putative DNA primase/helicase
LNYVYGFDKEIIDYLLSSKVTDLMTCSDRTGWVNDVFITPKRVYGDDADSYTYQPTGAIDNKIGQAGTLADWQDNVSRYAQGNPLMMTCISESFTGALLKKSGMMGFGLHLWSSSSDGKTTTLHVACSVWGSEFWQQWLSTSVGIEGSAYAHNDLFLGLDEIGEASAQTVSATAYALANGEGKRRGGRDGNAKITKKWRVVFQSTGEKSLDTLMKEAGMVTRAGQEVRMINIRSDAGKWGAFNDLHGMENGSVFAEMLEANTKKYYGTAGDAWLDAITQPGGIPEDISQSVDAIREAILPEGASGQVRRVARQFALIAYAGELATKHGVTGWKAGEATAAAKECFLLWVDDFGGADGKREHRQVLESVESFLFANITPGRAHINS